MSNRYWCLWAKNSYKPLSWFGAQNTLDQENGKAECESYGYCSLRKVSSQKGFQLPVMVNNLCHPRKGTGRNAIRSLHSPQIEKLWIPKIRDQRQINLMGSVLQFSYTVSVTFSSFAILACLLAFCVHYQNAFSLSIRSQSGIRYRLPSNIT